MIPPIPSELAQNPLAALTMIAAPAILTNATSTLAQSTLNRMFRTRDRMNELLAKSEAGNLPETEAAFLLEQVNQVERQAVLLLRALYGARRFRRRHAHNIARGSAVAFVGCFMVSRDGRIRNRPGLGGRGWTALWQRETVQGHPNVAR